MNLRLWTMKAKNLISFSECKTSKWKFKSMHVIVFRNRKQYRRLVCFARKIIYNANESGFNFEIHSRRTLAKCSLFDNSA